MAESVTDNDALRVDTVNYHGLNGSTSPASASLTQNRLLQVSAGDGVQQVQLRRKRTASSSSAENPFLPDSALSAEVDKLLRNSRIVLEGDRIVMKIEEGEDNGNGNGKVQSVGSTMKSAKPSDAVDNTVEVVQVKKQGTLESAPKANGSSSSAAQSGVVESAKSSAAQVPSNQVEIVHLGKKKKIRCSLM